MLDLRQRYGTTALVTGASAGIGRAFARALAARGMDVIVTARRAERLEALRDELEAAHGGRVHVIAADLADPAAPAAIEQALAERGLTVDLLVNNAGFGRWGAYGSYPLQVDLDMIAVNCRAVAELTHRLLGPMKARGRGAVIIVSSVLAEVPVPWFATYAATKAFDRSLGESLFGELRPLGIDVLAVEPTLTDTEFKSGSGMRNMRVRIRTAEDVVRTSLGALGRRASVADGWRTRCWLAAARLLPRRLLIAISSAFSSAGQKKKP